LEALIKGAFVVVSHVLGGCIGLMMRDVSFGGQNTTIIPQSAGLGGLSGSQAAGKRALFDQRS